MNERAKEKERSSPTYDFASPRAPIGKRADCEGIKFVTGELRCEWHTEERDFYAGGRKNNYRAGLIDRPGYRLLVLFLNNIDDIAETDESRLN